MFKWWSFSYFLSAYFCRWTGCELRCFYSFSRDWTNVKLGILVRIQIGIRVWRWNSLKLLLPFPWILLEELPLAQRVDSLVNTCKNVVGGCFKKVIWIWKNSVRIKKMCQLNNKGNKMTKWITKVKKSPKIIKKKSMLLTDFWRQVEP